MRPGHPALVSDLIEEFRAIIVDTVVLNLVLNRRITPNQFTVQKRPGSPCLLDTDDSVRWYPLCRWCSEAICRQGQGPAPDNPEYFQV